MINDLRTHKLKLDHFVADLGILKTRGLPAPNRPADPISSGDATRMPWGSVSK